MVKYLKMDYLFIGNIDVVFDYSNFYDTLDGRLIVMDKVGKISFFLKIEFNTYDLTRLETKYREMGYGPFRINKYEYDSNKGNFIIIETNYKNISYPNNRAAIINEFFCIDGIIFMEPFEKACHFYLGLREIGNVSTLKMPDSKFYFKNNTIGEFHEIGYGYEHEYGYQEPEEADFKQLDGLEFEVITDMVCEDFKEFEFKEEEPYNIEELDNLEFVAIAEELENNAEFSLQCNEILVNSFD